ncbi:hypothetical protein [Corynebacterium falsenii]|uniref:hypothetical protein n=1 Tax=Corynebacterium falsenii TaxID=108486 RepID=UPI001DF33252|nr:hypothetical protein [Corynebacterium falsenii]HJF11985.1 hypothetical protein [Corynebacterium falsenii]
MMTLAASAETYVQMGHALLNVLIVAIILGSGLPVLFAIGVRLEAGTPDNPPRPIQKFLAVGLFLFCLVVIVNGILWLMDSTIAHYTGVDLFGTANKSDG